MIPAKQKPEAGRGQMTLPRLLGKGQSERRASTRSEDSDAQSLESLEVPLWDAFRSSTLWIPGLTQGLGCCP